MTSKTHNAKSSNGAHWLRRIVAILIVGAGIAAVVIAWLPKPVPVDVAKATRGPLSVSIDEDGKTRVKDRHIISAPLLGNLSRIELDAGDSVEPGTVIARLLPLSPSLLDPRQKAQLEARVAAAQAARRQAHASVGRIRTALEFAEREAERQRGLHKRGAAPELAVERAELERRSLREELASAEFGTKVADYELRMAQAALGRTAKDGEGEQLDITSPVGGRILKIIQQSEGVVQPGTPLVEVGDPTALEIVVDVLTADAVEIAPGTAVRIERWGGGYPLEAHVRLVEPSAFTRLSALGVEEQRVNVIVDLDEPHERWAALGDGYRVEARIITFHTEDALTVPSSAVFRRGSEHACFRVGDGGKASLVAVEIGKQNAQQVEVVKGVSAGDDVVIHPSDRVDDGVPVQPR